MPVHPTAIVDPAAKLAPDVDVGPYSIIQGEVTIAAGSRLMAHVYLEGPATIGGRNVFFPYAVVGVASPDLKYKGEPSETRIGHGNTIREFVSIHRGTQGGGLVTSIGDENLLMANAHVAHDCRVENHCILANGATLGGHVTVQDWAIVGAFSGVHQFCRVGRHAFIGGYSVITQDVLPYSNTTQPRDPRNFGANKVGLERRGFSPQTIGALHKTFRILTRSGLKTSEALERIRTEVPDLPEVRQVIEFMQLSERGVVK